MEKIFGHPCPPYRIRTDYGEEGPWWGYHLKEGVWTKGQNNGMGQHSGYDFPCPSRTPLYAVCDGKILLCGKNERAGMLIILRPTGEDYNIQYSHLTTWEVKEGAVVKQGDMIALSGKSGNVTGPHLHLSFRRPDGQWFPVHFVKTAYKA